MSDAIALRGVEKSFGATKIIRGVDLAIPRGERHAMIGPNGAGKTTLFNLISGRFPVSAGTIEVNGRSIARLAPHQINRLGLSRSFQITSIFPRMTVFENIRCGLLWARGYRYAFWRLLGAEKALNEEADRILERLGLKEPQRDRAGGAADPQRLRGQDPADGRARHERRVRPRRRHHGAGLWRGHCQRPAGRDPRQPGGARGLSRS
jgi:ABC-type branched-subunit amino acid transport system ATPase component